MRFTIESAASQKTITRCGLADLRTNLDRREQCVGVYPLCGLARCLHGLIVAACGLLVDGDRSGMLALAIPSLYICTCGSHSQRFLLNFFDLVSLFGLGDAPLKNTLCFFPTG